MSLDPAFVPILPRTAGATPQGHLTIGGCDAVELAREFGTPLYVFDEVELRAGLPRVAGRVPLPSRGDDRHLRRQGLSRPRPGPSHRRGGAGPGRRLRRRAGDSLRAPSSRWSGSTSTATTSRPQELREALAAGVGHVVVDNFHEAVLLNDAAGDLKRKQPVLLRVSPNVDPHTHQYITTGTLDSKFGVAIATGQAEEAVLSLTSSPWLELVGLHAHIGSQIFELEPYAADLPRRCRLRRAHGGQPRPPTSRVERGRRLRRAVRSGRRAAAEGSTPKL